MKLKQNNQNNKIVKCAFCDKKFANVFDAKKHEDSYHKKLLDKLMQKSGDVK